MLQYKDQPLIQQDLTGSIDKKTVKAKRKVLDKDMEVTVYLILFMVVGGEKVWAFETEKERDFVFGNVCKHFEIEKLDNF